MIAKNVTDLQKKGEGSHSRKKPGTQCLLFLIHANACIEKLSCSAAIPESSTSAVFAEKLQKTMVTTKICVADGGRGSSTSAVFAEKLQETRVKTKINVADGI